MSGFRADERMIKMTGSMTANTCMRQKYQWINFSPFGKASSKLFNIFITSLDQG